MVLILIILNLYIGHQLVWLNDQPVDATNKNNKNINNNHLSSYFVPSLSVLDYSYWKIQQHLPTTTNTADRTRSETYPLKQRRQEQEETSSSSLDHNQHEGKGNGDSGDGSSSSKGSGGAAGAAGVCHGYKGVLHIAMGDIGGGAGTIFFQFVIGQLIYAEQYQLIPWIHFNNVSNIIYDANIHGTGPGQTLVFSPGITILNASTIVRRGNNKKSGHWRDQIPGPPLWPDRSSDARTTTTRTRTRTVMHFPGTGVWDHYFQPVVPAFDPMDPSCQALPYYITLTLKQITPGIHGFAPWAPRCWRYHYLPDYVTKPHIPLHEWLRPSRLLGHAAVQRYQIRFLPSIEQAAARANPQYDDTTHRCTGGDHHHRDCGGGPCALGLHIRHSDKAAGRRQVPVEEFLPFVQAFVHAGGTNIYLATDSLLVLEEIAQTWPKDIQTRIKSLGNGNNHESQESGEEHANVVVRSRNDQAVFDIAASYRHTTNLQAMVEIKALSMCRFMVHGLSALSESALWLNKELQSSSVNLEDPDHISPSLFGTLVQMVLRDSSGDGGGGGVDSNLLPKPPPSSKWWKVRPNTVRQQNERVLPGGQGRNPLSLSPCPSGYKGIFLISSAGGDRVSVDMAFFTHILNQLLYAEEHNWLPWIHLQPRNQQNSVLYDRWAHQRSTDDGNRDIMVPFKIEYSILIGESGYPEAPTEVSSVHAGEQVLHKMEGNGIWESYFYPASTFAPQHDALDCRQVPMATMTDPAVISLTTKAPWAVRAWKYDLVPESLWKPIDVSWKDWYAPIRKRANSVIQKHYRFRPYLTARADAANPIQPHEVCVSVHMSTAKGYQPYLEEFVRGGGNSIYIATSSSRALRYVDKTFPSNITSLIRSQGDQVVRTSKDWPLHMIDNHHRVNSEALVDILAMSKCQFLLHTTSTQSEAAIYLNLELHNQSVNVEDPDRMPIADFGEMVKGAVADKAGLRRQQESDHVPQQPGPLIQRKLENTTIILRDTTRPCRKNALVYLAQKKHSSYHGKDSYASLLRSLDLVKKNYLALNNHLENLDLFIFHTNDFSREDLEALEKRLGPSFCGVIRLVNLSGSRYWQRPPHQVSDDPNTWYAYPLFSEGYRRMMHWFAIGIWDFFSTLNDHTGCNYRYIFRLDEDSFLHSPIRYDIFEFMQSNQYVYGYRMCAYEMQVTRRMWTLYKKRNPNFQPQRDVQLEMCGFYNNFFVADLEFFQSGPVQKFLHFIDRQGHIYRRRLGDLMIHSMSVYAFAEQQQIHRFLDFTYEHGTFNQTDGCLSWGGMQAGYNDENATATLSEFYQEKLLDRGCFANATIMRKQDLSPSYAHVADEFKETLALHTITAGRVEFPLGKGILSG